MRCSKRLLGDSLGLLGDFLGGGALLLERGRDGGRDGIHVANASLREWTACTAWETAAWIAAIWRLIPFVASAVWLARCFTSVATTAKPIRGHLTVPNDSTIFR